MLSLSQSTRTWDSWIISVKFPTKLILLPDLSFCWSLKLHCFKSMTLLRASHHASKNRIPDEISSLHPSQGMFIALSFSYSHFDRDILCFFTVLYLV